MKSYIRITVLTAVIFLVGIILLAVLTSKTVTQDTSRQTITALNDIARTAEAHRSKLDILSGNNYNGDFVILDMTDNVLYSNTDEKDKLTVEKAIQKRYPYQYLKDDSGVWGCVIMTDDGLDGYRMLRLRFIAGMSVGGVIILLGMVGFGVYLNRNVITPFKRMQSFAGKVAEGRLDEPLAMDRDNLFGAFSESFDIMREELSASKQRELELQKKERELVASLSHDLKTPVTGIKLAAELLQMRLSVKAENSDSGITFSRDETNSINDSVDGILQKSEQINSLVSDLFTATLDDLGEFKVNCRDENSAVLADIVKSCDDKHYAVMGELPQVIISIDRKRMTQVVGNIISNSYKYADTAINVDFKLSEGFLEMRLQDHGNGVSSEEIELITNKFYRGKEWADSEKDGNGLGLYIAKSLMKKMNGDLTAESDGGLAVTLIIPLS
ncbi:ATPase/histidine kinase/DNA gyrase B/HSP90 domain protein [Ruminococcus albus 8]|uniref:histidine kinase n=1 Tax=Ruminococcus albus 8 TaxID=246199 RepID=E9SDZ7_RUMAL|nr:HAMP domain-containing sensor histidine kinase [Ruminococcus albus]EGC02474.1 ATPase/histidine kinase/DNA gyrase B/HSP90 domain protein [Ruminococcus albus 8]